MESNAMFTEMFTLDVVMALMSGRQVAYCWAGFSSKEAPPTFASERMAKFSS